MPTPNLPTFDNGKTYVFSGKSLNRLMAEIRRITPRAGEGIDVAEMPNGIAISVAPTFGNSESGPGVTGFCVWDYEDSATATTFWQQFENGILVNASSEPAPFDPVPPGGTLLFRLPISIP